MKFVTDPKQAREVRMRDGTRYGVSPSGSFIVTDVRHLDEMAQGDHDYYASATAFRGRGWECPCSHACWGWQRVCPKCGLPRQT